MPPIQSLSKLGSTDNIFLFFLLLDTFNCFRLVLVGLYVVLGKFAIQYLAFCSIGLFYFHRVSDCSPLVLLLFCWFIVTMMSEPVASFTLRLNALCFHVLYLSH